MRMRTALIKSKNLVSVRILQAITPRYAQDYITRFGFDAKYHPPYLTMALGAGNVTPLQWSVRMRCSPTAVSASALFYRAYRRRQGQHVAQARPQRAGENAGALSMGECLHHGQLMQDV